MRRASDEEPAVAFIPAVPLRCRRVHPRNEGNRPRALAQRAEGSFSPFGPAIHPEASAYLCVMAMSDPLFAIWFRCHPEPSALPLRDDGEGPAFAVAAARRPSNYRPTPDHVIPLVLRNEGNPVAMCATHGPPRRSLRPPTRAISNAPPLRAPCCHPEPGRDVRDRCEGFALALVLMVSSRTQRAALRDGGEGPAVFGRAPRCRFWRSPLGISKLNQR